MSREEALKVIENMDFSGFTPEEQCALTMAIAALELSTETEEYGMSRLTWRQDGEAFTNYLTKAVVDKLADYEDKQEQGLLPSRSVFESEGDTVYYIFDYEISECINCGISVDADGVMWIALACYEHIFPYREPIAEFDTDPTDWCLNTTSVKLEEWEKTVFLTRSEAEEALAKMGE